MKRIYKSLALCLIVAVYLFAGTHMLQTSAATKEPESKKGLQGMQSYNYSESEYNAEHLLDNLYLSDYYSDSYVSGWKKHTAGGKTFYIDENALSQKAYPISLAHDAGKTTYCTLLLRNEHAYKLDGLGYTGKATSSNTLFRGFNTKNSNGCAVVQEVFKTVGKYLGGLIDYWIISNEVNQIEQYDLGITDPDKIATNYAKAMTICYKAMKSYNKKVSVLASIDHCWTITSGYRINVPNLLTAIQKYTSSHTDFNWGVAAHPYSEPLGEGRFWLGHFSVTDAADSPVVTMKNIDVLVDFMKKSGMRYKGNVRPISLTEFGLSSNQSEANQAAGVAYSYYIAESNPYIISILYREPKTEEYGFGIDGKEAETVFKYMDTTAGHWYTDPYLKQITSSGKWSDIVSNYKNVNINKEKLAVKVSSNIDKNTKSGDTVSIKAQSKGNTGDTLYQFVLATGKNYEATLILQDYGKDATFKGKIRTDGPARIYVNAKDSKSTATSSYIKIGDNGVKNTNTGLEKIGTTLCYINNGKWQTSFNSSKNGFKQSNGKQYYLVNGKVDTAEKALYKNPKDKKYYYFEKGVFKKASLVMEDIKTEEVYDSWWGYYYTVTTSTYKYVKNGIWDKSASGLKIYKNVLYYFKKGELDSTYSGLKKYNGKYYLISCGKQKSDLTGFAQSSDGKSIYYIKNGIYKSSVTGIVEVDGYKYYVQKGKLISGEERIITVNKKKYLLTNCYVYPYYDNYSYTTYSYATGCMVDTSEKRIYYSNDDKNYYYFNKGQVDTSITGIIANGWNSYYFKKGVCDSTFTGIVSVNKEYYYIENGVVNSYYTGIQKCPNGKTYYFRNGSIATDYTGTTYYNGSYYYIVKGVWKSNYSGLCSPDGYVNSNSAYVKKGIVDTSFNGYVNVDGTNYPVKYGYITNDNVFVKIDGVTYLFSSMKIDYNSSGYIYAYSLDSQSYLYMYVENGIAT